MASEDQQNQSTAVTTTTTAAATTMNHRRALLIINCIILAVGTCGGPLIMRLYFVHGGKRVWLSSFLETAGFPIILSPLAVSYLLRRRCDPSASPVQLNRFLLLASVVVGVLTGVDDYLYAYGLAKLPVSTASLIIASQLAFTAIFAFLLVRQRFTAYSLNAIVILTVGAVVLAMHGGADRPKGESNRDYMLGFLMTVAAAVLYGFVLPLVELTYKKSKVRLTYSVVLEFQFVMCIFASAFCVVGMLVNNDFKVIPREAREFGLGETKYYVVAVLSAIIWQGFFLGAIGIIFCSSSLFSGVVITVLLPITEVLAVIFYKESFGFEKGVSLFLSLWGFVSYFYGEKKLSKTEVEKPKEPETEMAQV